VAKHDSFELVFGVSG